MLTRHNHNSILDQSLIPTPSQILGPYYPLSPDASADNDLLRFPNTLKSAQGESMYVEGQVLSLDGHPIDKTLIEDWQCDANGIYSHPEAPDHQKVDPHFKGYGRFVTSSDGRYSLHALRPVKYSGRAPHLHLKITVDGYVPLITQMYIKGEVENDDDFALQKAGVALQRAQLLVELAERSDMPEDYYCCFNIILEPHGSNP